MGKEGKDMGKERRDIDEKGKDMGKEGTDIDKNEKALIRKRGTWTLMLRREEETWVSEKAQVGGG